MGNHPIHLHVGRTGWPDPANVHCGYGFRTAVSLVPSALSDSDATRVDTRNPVMLNVFGTKGDADPQNGEYEFVHDDEVSLRVSDIVTEGTTRYICTGATVRVMLM